MGNWRWGWAFGLGLGLAIAPIAPSQAQIIPDGSLGNEGSLTTPTGTGVQIDGGALRGDNLFHSFQEFSVPTNSEAFFNNPDVANIFSRVTGGSISDIDGLLRANGTANLFLLNPNGIIFGPNARLDIGGSFVASTANSLVFENGLAFNAGESGEAPLLSVNVPLGVQFNDNPGSIEATGATLNVSEGESVALVGGEISLDDVEINAPAGRIDLVGVGEAGQVRFETSGVNSGFPSGGFGVPADLSRASVSLNETTFDVTGLVGGEIGIQALDVEMRDSVLRGGVAEGLGIEGGQSGNIELDAIGHISISDSRLNNEVEEGSIGNAGDINLLANTVEMTNGARLTLSTTGRGNAGSVTVNANESIVISGSNPDEFPSGINVSVGEGGQGDVGQVNLSGEFIEISDGAFILSGSLGEGNTGNVTLEARETISLLTEGRILTAVLETGQGNVGNISVIGSQVEVRDGAQLSSMTSGQGNAGGIDIHGSERIVFSGEDSEGLPSAAFSFSDVGETGQGNAGDINLISRVIQTSDGAFLSSSTSSNGDAGNVTLEAHDSVLLSGGFILSDSSGETQSGNAGNVRITGERIELRDEVYLSSSASGDGDGGTVTVEASGHVLLSDSSASSNSSGETQSGNAGSVRISGETVELRDGANLSSSTWGDGDAGTITVEASGHVLLSDMFALSSGAGETRSGNAGNIRIIGETIELRDETRLFSSARGDGDGGTVTVEASGHILFSNSLASSSSAGEGRSGNAGNVRVIGETVELRDGSRLSSETSGDGEGGTITVEASGHVLFSDSSVSSSSFGDTPGVNAGNIRILGETVELRDGARLSSNTLGEGNAGTVTVEASGHILFSDSSASSSSLREDSSGNAGNVRISGETVELRDGSRLSSNTSGDGDGGTIAVEAGGHVLFSDSSVSSASLGESHSGTAGNITIVGERVELRDGTSLLSSTQSQGDAGNIRIIGETVELRDETRLFSSTRGDGDAGTIRIEASGHVIFSDSSASSSSFGDTQSGNAGNIRITGETVELRDGARLASDTSGEGYAGRVIIEASGHVLFLNSSASSSSFGEDYSGNAGNIRLIGETVELRDGASLFSSTLGQGDAGSVTIEASDTAQLSNANVFSTVEERAKGNGGDIQIITNTLFLEDGAQLNVNTLGEGNAGTIIVQAHDRVMLSGVNSDGLGSRVSSVVAESGRGNAGGVTILSNILELHDGARLNSNTLGEGNAGTVTVEANSEVLLSNSFAVSGVGENARGNAGGVRISADSLEMRDGAQLNAGTAGQGNAGTVTVEASGEVLLSNSFAVSLVGENARGNAGGVRISANSLEMRDGAQLNSSTLGQGNGGTVTIEANDRVIFSGVNSEGFPSFGFTSVGETGQGDAGDVRVLANSLELRDGAALDSSVYGEGNAGTVSIEVSERFLLSNGLVASGIAETGRGNAGNVTVVADRLEVYDGLLVSSSLNQGDAGTVTVEVHDTAIFSGFYTGFSVSAIDGWPSGVYSTIEETGQGNAGGVNLIAGTVELREGTRLSSSNNTTSNANDFTAGDVFVQADRLHLSDRADISANTGGRGGNIQLNTGTTILRRGSTIQTNAEGDFPGGNIIIDTDALVALENSDITANALNAAGGRVIINSQGIFGTEFRDELTPQSDITATSELGAEFSGSVELNTPEVDTATGLVDLSANPIDVAALLDTDPCTLGRESEFYVTGRGGLPPNPDGSLATETTWVDWRSLEDNPSETALSRHEEMAPLVEAQGWHINGEGSVVLSAATPDGSPTPPQGRPVHCSPEQLNR